MAVQSEILTRTVTFAGDGLKGKFASGTGTLAMGIPGKIYDTFPGAGPGCHTTTLKEDAEVGTFLAGQGIIVNAPEYALQGSPTALSPSLTLKAGTVVSCVTMGHVIVKESSVDAILAGFSTTRRRCSRTTTQVTLRRTARQIRSWLSRFLVSRTNTKTI